LRKFENKAAEVHRYLGANQFTGNVEAFKAPRPRSYLYGPDINVTGLVVSGRRLDFVRRAANFLELTVAQEIGSCPYLQSWNGRDQEWINHGKILHRAQGRAREYAETIVFSDFRPSFRLEEREAEVAFIDHAELSLTLTNGAIMSLPPDEPRLAHRDLDYLELMWGDRVTFRFSLPDGISSDDVESSRLTLSGYYERYADLLAGSSDPGSSDSPARGGYFRSDIGNGSLKALVCPVTVARPEPADQLLSRLLPKGGSDVSKAGHPVARRDP